VCDLDVMSAPSKLSVIRKAEILKLQKSGQFPDEPVRIKV
jgi:hypothetical protein